MKLSEKYAYKIYEKMSFSAAAKALFVSQPSLSAMVSRLERDLGFKIFDRSTNPLSLTPSGRIYVEYLEDIKERERNMHHRIHQLSDMFHGSLSVGGLCHSAYYLLPSICGRFFNEYPEIVINLIIGNKSDFGGIKDAVRSHALDLVMTYNYDPREFDAEPLIEERLVIAVSRKLPSAAPLLPLTVTREELLRNTYDKSKEISDFSLFRELNFLSFKKVGNTVNRLIDKLDDNYKLSSYHIKSSEHLTMHYNMMCAGLGAFIAADTHIRQPLFNNDDIVYLIPKCEEAKRTLHFVMRPDSTENIIVKNFIATAKEFCADLTSNAP